MRTVNETLLRVATDSTGGGTTLFDKLYKDAEKTLKEANKDLLQDDIKMTLKASVHEAKKSINRAQAELNKQRADLENIDFEAILETKATIADWEEQIASAQEEYLLFFGVTID